MGLFSRDIRTMDDLFVHGLRDAYYAEKRILKALPDIIGKASDPELQITLRAHFAETEDHLVRLEEVFRLHGAEAKTVVCHTINGIMDEAEYIVREIADPEVLDAALAVFAQEIEHYAMIRYGTLTSWARRLGRADCARVLQRTLDDAKAADRKLTAIAEAKLNVRAGEDAPHAH
ncbi:YciE/YciF family protein [Azorhizobium oxalatiphilum]|uniref:YciE/YciF family protein n=1 Tax=Azorhizobium oxalatiphilum TaxID=980631 RepID=A0A917FG54_9HYPH|nr:ferritin-like domain-containing protein [Azorhizobium oxalatiphilum]GGF74546.1 YciE/YciF family protein [Azorhizobium oxalatiphilum]